MKKLLLSIALLVLSLQSESQPFVDKLDNLSSGHEHPFDGFDQIDTLNEESTLPLFEDIPSSKEFGYKNLTSHNKIGGLIVLEYPFKKQPVFGKRTLKAEQQELENYVAQYLPMYIVVDYTKDIKNRKKCKKLVLLHKFNKETFFAYPTTNPVTVARWLKKHMPVTNYPHSEKVFLDLLKMAITQSDVHSLMQYAPTERTLRSTKLNYLAPAKNLKRLQLLANKISKPGLEQSDLICVSALQQQMVRTSAQIQYFQKECGCDPEKAIRQASEFLRCEELISFGDSLPVRYKAIHLENIECFFVNECLSKTEWDEYYATFQSSGNCMAAAFKKMVMISIVHNEQWVFLQDHRQLAEKYKTDIQEPLQNSFKDLESVLSYTNIYNDSASHRHTLLWALNNLKITNIRDLLNRPAFNTVKNEIEHQVYALTETELEWALFFKEWYPQSAHIENVYSNILDLQTDPVKKREVVLEIVNKFPEDGIKRVKSHVDCDLAFDIVSTNPDMVAEMHSKCLDCVSNLATLIRFGEVYDIEEGFDQIASNLSAAELRELFDAYPKLHQKIGEVYPDAARNTADCDWYLRNFPDDIRKEMVSEKGIDFEREDSGRGIKLTERVTEHSLDFGFDSNVISQNINCEQMSYFLPLVRQAPWFDKVAGPALKCADSKSIEELKEYFGHLPKFQTMLFDNQVESIAEAQRSNSSNPPLNFSKLLKNQTDSIAFDIKDFQNPVMILNGKGFDSDIKMQITIGKEVIPNPFSANQKALFLPTNSSKGLITITNLNKGGWFESSNSSPISFQIYDCPPILKGRLKLIVEAPYMREEFQHSCEKLWSDEADKSDYERILGYELLRYIENAVISEDQLKGISYQVSEVFITLAKPYFPQGWFDKAIKKFERSTK